MILRVCDFCPEQKQVAEIPKDAAGYYERLTGRKVTDACPKCIKHLVAIKTAVDSLKTGAPAASRKPAPKPAVPGATVQTPTANPAPAHKPAINNKPMSPDDFMNAAEKVVNQDTQAKGPVAGANS